MKILNILLIFLLFIENSIGIFTKVNLDNISQLSDSKLRNLLNNLYTNLNIFNDKENLSDYEKLSGIKVLTFWKNRYTTFNRTHQTSQLLCDYITGNNGKFSCNLIDNNGYDNYPPYDHLIIEKMEYIECVNVNVDINNVNVIWKCSSPLEKKYKLGKTQIVCEHNENDITYILKGSCAVKYELIHDGMLHEPYKQWF